MRKAIAAVVTVGLTLATAWPIQAGRVAETYKVRVESSFGLNFEDCFASIRQKAAS
jgi:hypothetical protein